MTHSIDQTLHQFANLLPNWTLLPILTLLPNFGGFHRTLQRVWLANRGRLLLRTPGPVPFGTCICSNVETILSWICHVYGPIESRTSLGTSILLSYIWSLFFLSYNFLFNVERTRKIIMRKNILHVASTDKEKSVPRLDQVLWESVPVPCACIIPYNRTMKTCHIWQSSQCT